MVVKKINNELALINDGFKEYEYEDVDFHMARRGFIKVIPGTFRFKYKLFVPSCGEVTGFISGMYRGEDALTFDQFIDRMKFRTPDIADSVKVMMDRLVENNDIELE